VAGSAHRSLDGRRAAADQLAHRDRHLGRVVADLAGRTDQLDGLRRIGIDEIAHRKGHRYLSVVVDHDTGRLVWAAAGRDTATLHRFFDALGEARSARLGHVSADGAEWIHTVVAERAPQATLCLDPFHVVAWDTKALDAVRRDLWNELRAEATNVHLRVLTRRAYGFHTPDALIAMAMLTRGGLCPDLPGRT